MNYEHKGLAHHQADTNCLTEGPTQSAMYANQKLHPTIKMQENNMINKEKKHLQDLSVGYGSHMAMRHVIDASILSQVQRPSGHRSNMFGLNHHLGRFHELDTFDILNDPNGTPDIDKVGNRSRTERAMHM